MVVGIKSYGAYIPMYRLDLNVLSQVWGHQIGHGERAIANWDEDSLTMATEAAIDCLTGMSRKSVDGLYYATTTPVYTEKQNASIMAKVLDFRRNILSADFCNSLRSGTNAFIAALHGVQAGAATNVLVASSDCRVPAPDSTFEGLFGDGAAALLVGDTDVIAEVQGSYSISSDFLDIWKRGNDAYVQTWEDRFTIEHGYFDHIQEAIQGLFEKNNVGPEDFAKIVLYGYDARRHTQLCKRLGFDVKTQVQDPLLTSVGNTGSASAMMMLVAALEQAKPDDRILFVNYGDGCDCFILRVTQEIERVRNRRGISRHLTSKAMLANYGKYLHFRNLVEWEVSREIPKMASLPMTWRDRDWVLSFKGAKCRQCGGIQFPPQRICPWCQAKDDFEEALLSEKKGMLAAYGIDYLAVCPDPPLVGVVVDFEGGGRFSTTLTDRDVDKLAVGMQVEPTFRIVHESRGYMNYFWKCRPIRA